MFFAATVTDSSSVMSNVINFTFDPSKSLCGDRVEAITRVSFIPANCFTSSFPTPLEAPMTATIIGPFCC